MLSFKDTRTIVQKKKITRTISKLMVNIVKDSHKRCKDDSKWESQILSFRDYMHPLNIMFSSMESLLLLISLHVIKDFEGVM